MKTRLNRHSLVSSRTFARELGISESSVQRILKSDLKLQTHKMQNETMLTDGHKTKKIKIRKLRANQLSKRRHDEDSVFRRKIVRH